MPRKKRIYKKGVPGSEYEYDSKPEKKRKNVIRRRDRREALRDGRVKKGDGKDIHHDWSSKDGGKKTIKSASSNRSYARTKTARKKNPKS